MRVVGFALIVLGGCSLVVDPDNTTGPCSSNDDCGSGLCLDGECVLTVGDPAGGDTGGDAADPGDLAPPGDIDPGDLASPGDPSPPGDLFGGDGGDLVPGEGAPGEPSGDALGPRIVLSWPSVTLCENGPASTQTLTVALSEQPTDAVLVHVEAPSKPERRLGVNSAASSFADVNLNASSWSTSVTLQGVENGLLDGMGSVTVTASTDGTSGDAAFHYRVTTFAVPMDDCAIILYPLPTGTNGLLGANAAAVRMNADTDCAASAPTPECDGRTVWAVLSVSSSDDIANRFSTTDQNSYALYGILGPRLALSWGDALASSLPVDLNTATGLGDVWWSGSNSGGAFAGVAAACSAWTVATGTGRVGKHDDLSQNGWIGGDVRNCDQPHPLLCSCY